MLPEDQRSAKLVAVTDYIQHELIDHEGGSNAESGKELSTSAPPKKAKLSLFQKFRSSGTSSFASSELTLEKEIQHYCEMDIPGDDIGNPLDFWKQNRARFPRLTLAASKALVVPATSASSERTFSSAGRVYEQRRSSMNPCTLDAILRVRSFLLDPVEKP